MNPDQPEQGNTLEMINGKKVEQRTSAKAPLPSDRSRVAPIKGVDEVLLENGTIVYQCVRSRHCLAAFDQVTKAIPHLRSHGGVQAAARRDRQIDAERDRAEKYSAAGKTAQEVRKARIALLLGDESRAAWLIGLADTLVDAAPVLRQLAQIKVEVQAPPVTDDELMELRRKAKKWDDFMAMTRD